MTPEEQTYLQKFAQEFKNRKGIAPERQHLHYALKKYREGQPSLADVKETGMPEFMHPRPQPAEAVSTAVKPISKSTEEKKAGLEKAAEIIGKGWEEAGRPRYAIANIIKFAQDPEAFYETHNIPESPFRQHVATGQAFWEGLTKKEKGAVSESFDKALTYMPEEWWVLRGTFKTIGDISDWVTDPRYWLIGKAIGVVAKGAIKASPEKIQRFLLKPRKLFKGKPTKEGIIRTGKPRREPLYTEEYMKTGIKTKMPRDLGARREKIYQYTLRELLGTEKWMTKKIPPWAKAGADRWADFMNKYLGKLDIKVAEYQYISSSLPKKFVWETQVNQDKWVKALETILKNLEKAKAPRSVETLVGAIEQANYFVAPGVAAIVPEEEVIRKPPGAIEKEPETGAKPLIEEVYPAKKPTGAPMPEAKGIIPPAKEIAPAIPKFEHPIYYYINSNVVNKFASAKQFTEAVEKARTIFVKDKALDELSNFKIEEEFGSLENYYNWVKDNEGNISKAVAIYDKFIDKLPVDNKTKALWKKDPENLELNLRAWQEKKPLPAKPELEMKAKEVKIEKPVPKVTQETITGEAYIPPKKEIPGAEIEPGDMSLFDAAGMKEKGAEQLRLGGQKKEGLFVGKVEYEAGKYYGPDGEEITKEDYDFLYGEGEESLYEVIKSEGGIKSYKEIAGKKPLREEYREVPIHLRSKKGLPLDEMADVLKNRYPHFGIESESDLITALANYRRGGGMEMGAGISPEQMQFLREGGIEPIATTAEGRITQYQNQKIRFNIPKTTTGKGFKEHMHTLYTQGFDRFHPISRLVHKDLNLPPLEDPKLLSYLSTGWQGKVITALEGFTWRYTQSGKVEVTGPSLSQIIQPYSKNYKDIITLQVAQRELWLAEHGEEIKGITPDQSLKVIGDLKEKYGEEGFKKLEMVAQQKREWANRAILAPLRDVGRISEKQYQKWMKAPHVPFARVIDEIESELGAEGRKGDLGFLKELKGSKRIIKNPDQELISRLVATTQYVDKQRIINAIVNLPQIATDLSGEIYEVGKGDPSPFKLKSYEDGKAKYFRVPKDIYKSVKDITMHDVDVLWKIIGIPKRTLQIGATLNPAFMGRNIWRDSGTAFVFSNNNLIPFIDHLPAIANLIGRTDLYYRWLASGGAHAALVSMEDIKMGYKYWQLLGKVDVGAYIKNPLKFPEQIGETIENSTRLAEFRKEIKSGRPDLIAAYASKEVSVNFARYGAAMSIPRKTVAFYTANIAGGDRLVRAFKDHPGRSAWKAILFCTIPAIAEWVLFHNNERWQNLPPWRKYLFTNIPVGKHIFSMPVPFELGMVFGGLTKAFLVWSLDREPKVMEDWAKQFAQSMLPGYYGFPLPTAIMPRLEDEAKHSYFFNRPLPPKSVQGLPEEMQYTPYTSETAKAIGKVVGKSPTVLENYLFSYTGGLGRDVLFMVDNILSKKGFIPMPEAELPKGLVDYPWTRGFVTREPIGTGSYPMQRFYEEFDEAKKQMNKMRVLTQRGKLTIEVFNQSESLAKYEALEDVKKEIDIIRRAREELLWSKVDPIVKKEQLDQLDATMTLIAAWTLKALNKRKFKK